MSEVASLVVKVAHDSAHVSWKVAIPGIMIGLVTIMADNVIHILTGWFDGVPSLFAVIPSFITMGVGDFIRTEVDIEVEGVDLIL